MPWPRKHHFLLWAFFLLLLVGSVDFLIQRILAQETQLRWQNDLQTRISHVRSQLEWSITGNLTLAHALAAYISVNPDLSEAEFQNFGSEIDRHSHRLRNLVAAPDYIIRYVYPPSEKIPLIGVDYRGLPEQWPLARLARENDSLVVAGPLPLVQGGRGIVGRVPVFTGHEDSRRFWGIVSSVIQFDELMAEIMELCRQLELEIALRQNNHNGAHTFYGDGSLFKSSQTITQGVRLPGSNWVLGARMRTEAPLKHPLSNTIHGSAVLAALLLCGLLLVVIRKNEALVTGEKLLQETNDQLEAFFGQSLDGFFFMMLAEPLDWDKVTDKEAEIDRIYANQRITKFNQAMLDQYGAKEADIRQRSPRDFFPEDPETGRHLWRQLFDTGRLHMEFREKRYDGQPILLEGDYLCLRNNKGAITGTFGVMRDVTATREAERQLERYIAIVDDNVLISQTDLAGNITYASKAFCRVSGYALEELIGKNHNIVRHPDMDDSIFKDLWQTIKAGRTWHGEVKNRKKNGGFFWVDSTVSPLKDNTGRIYGYMAVRQDITDRKRTETALRESEEKWRNILVQTPQVGVGLDRDARLVFANAHFLELTGWREDEVLGQNWFDLFLPEEVREDVRGVFHGAITSPEVLGYSTYENEILTKTGERRNIAWSNVVTKDACGTVVDVTCLGIDLTERKRAEEALRESEKRFQDMLSVVPDMISIHDTDMNILYSNWQGFAAVPEERRVRKTKCHWTYRGLDHICPDCQARKVLESREAFQQEVLLPDGMWIDLRVIPLLDDAGRVQMYMEWVRDITQSKRAEEELRKREHLLQRIFDILPIGLWFADKEGNLLRGNAAGVRIWSAEPRVPISEYGIFKAWRLPSREPVAAEDWALARTIREGVTIVDELLEIEAFDGRRKTILNYSAPLLDDKGDVDGAIVVNLDISDRKALEAQLAQSQKMESVGRLAGGVAHDFNNMLNVILGHAEMVLDDLPASHPVRASIDEIRAAAQRSADLTRQLLAFARRQTVAPRVLDLNETVESMLLMLQRLIGEDIELLWRPGAAVPAVCMDPVQVDQMLANLIVNARDAIGHNMGRVTIETGSAHIDEDYCANHAGCAPGHYAALSVIDNGCGMDKETLDQVFEPFFTTKGVGEGTGLGMATVYGIVKQNHGFLDVVSEPGLGTTFHIYLPACVGGEEDAVQERILDAAVTGGDETILLVEDETAILKMARLVLDRLGYTVLAAATPARAIELANAHGAAIDMLITDVVMPGMHGRDLTEHLRSLYPELKCLFMSGYTADVIAHQGVLDEGVNFIQKPFSMKALGQKVREVLDS